MKKRFLANLLKKPLGFGDLGVRQWGAILETASLRVLWRTGRVLRNCVRRPFIIPTKENMIQLEWYDNRGSEIEFRIFPDEYEILFYNENYESAIHYDGVVVNYPNLRDCIGFMSLYEDRQKLYDIMRVVLEPQNTKTETTQ